MTGWLRIWMTGHFLTASNIEDQSQALQNSLWTPTNTTGIVIESSTRWAPELTEVRPSVIIKRNGWKRLRLGIGDKMMGTVQPSGQDVFANAWQGSHTLFCITDKGAETELLAAEVYRELNQFSSVFRDALALLRFEVSEVGELMLLEKARQSFVVPIVVAYAFVETWQLNQQAPIIKGIDLAMMHP
jgi:hypothetical protein